MCCAADRCREVLPHIVVSVVCLLSVIDVRTVASFKWQLVALEICFICPLHQYMNGHPPVFVCSSQHFGQSGRQCGFSGSCPVSISEITMSKATTGWKALEPLPVNKLLPGEEGALAPFNVCSGFSLLQRSA